MTKTFITVEDPVHSLVREITRHVPLGCKRLADGSQTILYQFQPSDLPDAYYALAMLHSIGGMSLDFLPSANWRMENRDKPGVAERVGCFDLVNLDRRCCRDLRLKTSKHPAVMLSAELLAFGTGVLRARNDDLEDPFHRYLNTEHGRLQPADETVYARIRALHARPGTHGAVLGKETFDSTDLIYGDALGELDQLWERRADIAFLDLVAHSLQGLSKTCQVGWSSHPPVNPRAIVSLHLQRQAIWKAPPKSGRALLRRLEAILEHTTVSRPSERSDASNTESEESLF